MSGGCDTNNSVYQAHVTTTRAPHGTTRTFSLSSRSKEPTFACRRHDSHASKHSALSSKFSDERESLDSADASARVPTDLTKRTVTFELALTERQDDQHAHNIAAATQLTVATASWFSSDFLEALISSFVRWIVSRRPTIDGTTWNETPVRWRARWRRNTRAVSTKFSYRFAVALSGSPGEPRTVAGKKPTGRTNARACVRAQPQQSTATCSDGHRTAPHRVPQRTAPQRNAHHCTATHCSDNTHTHTRSLSCCTRLSWFVSARVAYRVRQWTKAPTKDTFGDSPTRKQQTPDVRST